MTSLAAYLELERVSLAVGEETAEVVRGAMDRLWHRLTDAERAQLDARQVFIVGQTFTGDVGLRLPFPMVAP